MNTDVERLLGESEYFRGLSAESRKALAGISVERMVRKRDYVFTEGEKGESVFLLGSGSIQLVKSSAEGREVVIRTVEPGEVFAEVILFEQETYPVCAVAVQKSTVYALPRRGVLALLEDADFRRDFVGSLMRRLRYLTDRILHLTTYDVEERFFEFLKRQYGERERYGIAMSKKDMAAAIGTTPETFSRLVMRLQEEGKIRWKGKILEMKKRKRTSNVEH